MGFRPFHDWVLIARSEPEEKTIGGIIIPDAARTKPTEGIVVAIGPGKFEEEKGKGKREKKFVPTVLKPGQHVMFIDYMTKEITLNGETIMLIQEDNILGVFESVGALTVKKPNHIAVKKEHPPMVQKAKAEAAQKKAAPARTSAPKKDAAPKKSVRKTAAKKK